MPQGYVATAPVEDTKTFMHTDLTCCKGEQGVSSYLCVHLGASYIQLRVQDGRSGLRAFDLPLCMHLKANTKPAEEQHCYLSLYKVSPILRSCLCTFSWIAAH